MPTFISKNHEVNVLRSVFDPSQRWFEQYGYTGYSFEANMDNGLPDGYYKKDNSIIWVEHTQARLNYGESKSGLGGFEEFCLNVRKELKDTVNGCICCDIPSAIADKYLSSTEYQSLFLTYIQAAVLSPTHEYVNGSDSIMIKYCSAESCTADLSDYKGLRVITGGLNNIEFCKDIPQKVFESLIQNKEVKYSRDLTNRTGNWLFIEIPWGYTYDDSISVNSNVFDKIFTVERSCDRTGKECFKPQLIFTK